MKKLKKEKLAVGYCRVATTNQSKENASICAQEKLCKKSIKEDGLKVLKIIKDECKGGMSLNRAGIKELIQLVKKKEVDVIYTIHSDRISRNALDYFNLKKLFDENNVLLKCINQPVVEDSAVSKTMDTVMASFSEIYRTVISEKVKRASCVKVKNGYFPGMSPLGYQSVWNGSKRIIEIDKEKALLIKKAFKLYSTGKYKINDLSELLYKNNLLNKYGEKFSTSSVRNLLQNRFYLGEVKWGKCENKKGKHKPLINEQLFNKVQVVLKNK